MDSIRGLCGVYALMLYAYPRDFRRQYGKSMQQVFRDRCREQRGKSWFAFGLLTAADWITSVIRERRAASAATVVQTGSGRKLIQEWAVTLLLFLFVTTTMVQAYVVPTGSMENNILIGDHMLVDKVGFSNTGNNWASYVLPSRQVERGEIIAFRYPVDVSQTFVKRVIGLPGDTIELRDGRLFLNGQPVQREALPPSRIAVSPNSPCRTVPPSVPTVIAADGHNSCIYHAYLETLPAGPSYTVLDQVDRGVADDVPITRVPQGHLFMMGDNRDDSLDSRFPTYEGGIGMVPIENLIGRAGVTFWSTDGGASYLKLWTWFSALRGSRIGNGYSQ